MAKTRSERRLPGSKRARKAAAELCAPRPRQAVLFELAAQLAPSRGIDTKGAALPLYLPGDHRRGKRGGR
jgi:hypothetical protein